MILGYRLSAEEMDEIIRDDYIKISQRRLHEFVDNLGWKRLTRLSLMKHMLRRLFARPELSAEQHAILAALAGGQTLKSHRTIEGDKTYTLHALDGTTHSVSMDAVLDYGHDA